MSPVKTETIRLDGAVILTVAERRVWEIILRSREAEAAAIREMLGMRKREEVTKTVPPV